MRKIQIVIGLSSDLCNRLTWNLTGSCVRPATETSWAVSYGGKTIPRWRTAAILKIDISSYLSEKLSDFDEILYTAASSVTTGGNGGSCLRAPLERGRRVQTAMFFLFCLITTLYSNFILKYTTTAWKVNRVVSEHVKTLRPSLLVIMQQFIVN